MFRCLPVPCIQLFGALVMFVATSPHASAQNDASFNLQTMSANQYEASTYTADLNGDGVPDLITTYSRVNPVLFSVHIATGDGTFSPPTDYNSPINQQNGNVVVTGDVNNDGKFDVVAMLGADLFVYFRRGDGTFPTPVHSTLPGAVRFAAVADFNHDGNPDLALYFGDSNSVAVAYGDGKGGFSIVKTIVSFGVNQSVESMALGDFDADANADLAISVANAPCDQGGCASVDVHILYGSGSPSFTDKLSYAGLPSDLLFSSGDLNQDGRTDLIGFVTRESKNILVLYGHSTRRLSARHLKSNGPTFNWAFFVDPIADFNGDGRNDFAVEVVNTANQQAFDLFLRNADGTFTLQEIVFGQNSFEMGNLAIGDFNRDTKPDFLLPAKNDGGGDPATHLYSYLNTTDAQKFSACPYPNSAAGIRTCLHQSGAHGSIIKIDAAAAWFEPLRKVELWIDGVKVKEQHNVWDKYGWLHYSHKYAAGTHRADIYSAGYDNALQHATVSFSVRTQ